MLRRAKDMIYFIFSSLMNVLSSFSFSPQRKFSPLEFHEQNSKEKCIQNEIGKTFGKKQRGATLKEVNPNGLLLQVPNFPLFTNLRLFFEE